MREECASRVALSLSMQQQQRSMKRSYNAETGKEEERELCVESLR